MDSTSRAIGILEGKMDAALDILKRMEERMEALEARLSKTEAMATAVNKHIEDEVQPVVKKVNEYEARGVGIFIAFSLVSGFLMASVALVKDRIFAALGW